MTPTTTPTEPLVMTPERAVAWIDEVLEELGHALQACADQGVDEQLVSAKINGFVMLLMARVPDLSARAAQVRAQQAEEAPNGAPG